MTSQESPPQCEGDVELAEGSVHRTPDDTRNVVDLVAVDRHEVDDLPEDRNVVEELEERCLEDDQLRASQDGHRALQDLELEALDIDFHEIRDAPAVLRQQLVQRPHRSQALLSRSDSRRVWPREKGRTLQVGPDGLVALLPPGTGCGFDPADVPALGTERVKSGSQLGLRLDHEHARAGKAVERDRSPVASMGAYVYDEPGIESQGRDILEERAHVAERPVHGGSRVEVDHPEPDYSIVCLHHGEELAGDVEITVVIPTRCGGELLHQVVARVLEQKCARRFELVLVDSGSPEAELARLEAEGASVVRIRGDEFDHGATRDLGARHGGGVALVFINQDALPVGEGWLEGLTEPLFSSDPPAAVQGSIAEFPPEELERAGRIRFFWGTGGQDFYFTSESEEWIARSGGIGFSTVHCALRRDAWECLPFGRAPIMEDKKWQQMALTAGLRIDAVAAERALVWHSHQYDLRSLWKRCVSEGFGWRTIGVDYSLRAALADLCTRRIWRAWWRGLRSGGMRRTPELLFPVLRPLAVWWGNRWGRRSWV